MKFKVYLLFTTGAPLPVTSRSPEPFIDGYSNLHRARAHYTVPVYTPPPTNGKDNSVSEIIIFVLFGGV